jgi:hypothetical protein
MLKWDTDADGTISKEEFHQFFEVQSGEGGSGLQYEVRLGSTLCL